MFARGRAKVLVADDIEAVAEAVSLCLQEQGYEVLTAFDGEEALALARAEEPDLMVLDVMMPKGDGYQVARHVREDERAGLLSKRTRILMLTSPPAEKEWEELLQTWSGADEVIYKPFDLQELVGRVCVLLGRGGPTA